MKKKKAEEIAEQPKLDARIYHGLQPVIDTVATFARLCHQWVYVTDIERHTFLYISNLPGATFGTDSRILISSGYSTIMDRIVPNEQAMYNNITHALSEKLGSLDAQQLKNVSFSFSITSMVLDQPRLLQHMVSPLVNHPDGKPWIVLTMLSTSMHKEAGHLLCRLNDDTTEYDFEEQKWIPSDKKNHLTTSERNMLIYAARGYTIDEISKLMYRSVDTVKMYRRRIFSKLGVNNISEAIFHAVQQNLL